MLRALAVTFPQAVETVSKLVVVLDPALPPVVFEPVPTPVEPPATEPVAVEPAASAVVGAAGAGSAAGRGSGRRHVT